MGERRGYDTDMEAVADLFRESPELGATVIRDYLEPRSRRNAREKLLDRRDHFWTVDLTAAERERGQKRAAVDPLAQLVESKLKALTDSQFVSKATAAVYCGVSESTLDRHIRATGGLAALKKGSNTKLVRKRDAMGLPIPGNITERRFKMTAVKALKKTIAVGRGTPVVRAADSAAIAAAPSRKSMSVRAIVKDGGLQLTLPKALFDEVPWVLNADGEYVCHLTLNGLSPTAIAGFLGNGGTVGRASLHQAVVYGAWVFPDERAPWAAGLEVLLEREKQKVRKASADVAERALRRTLGPGRAAPSRHPL